jgi:fructokinase
MITKREEVTHPGFQVDVVDTIGSGDAFAAALAHFYMRRAPLKIISEASNRMGSWVATQVGATPEANGETMERIFRGVQLN